MAPDASLALIVGLGNPGPKYTETRHNVGFWWLDEVARRCGAVLRDEAKFFGDVGRVDGPSGAVHLLKPMTFMNRSGRAVAALANFYRLPPERILVIHDEIDLPAGAVKLKSGGGHGGHNGLRDIIQAIGRDFWRLRLGVGHPGHRDEVVPYVLSRAAPAERTAIDAAVTRSADEFQALVEGDFERVMQRLHTRT